MTCLSVGSVNENAVKVNNQDYWFNWDKIDDLRNDFIDFCSFKQRQLPDNDDGTPGMIIQESHENLSQYRSAIYFYREKARTCDGVDIDIGKIELYEKTLSGYFLGTRREEGSLKNSGDLSADKGGTIFPVAMYSDLCNRCYQTGHSKHGVF